MCGLKAFRQLFLGLFNDRIGNVVCTSWQLLLFFGQTAHFSVKSVLNTGTDVVIVDTLQFKGKGVAAHSGIAQRTRHSVGGYTAYFTE